MSRRVLVSFLGTSNYNPCCYTFDGWTDSECARFVQESIIRLECRDWGEKDIIIILTTELARKSNWLDSEHVGNKGERIKCEGLESRIKRMQLRARVKRLDIPDGKNQEELWEIFNRFFGELEEEDRVVFDVTHSFRSIPVLAVAVLNYAKVMKKIRIEHIYYGAYEAGTGEGDRRRAPILDLTALDRLMDWSFAVDRFVAVGDGTKVCSLARDEAMPLLRESKGKNEEAKSIRYIGESIEKFTRVLSTCRGPMITESVRRLKMNLESGIREAAGMAEPFYPLIELVKKELESFPGDEFRDGIAAVRWCLKRNMIQQAFTIFREVLITDLVNRAGMDVFDPGQRVACVQAAASFSRKDVGSGPLSHEQKEELESFLEIFRRSAREGKKGKLVFDLGDFRNDLNHAGFKRQPKEPRVFFDQLENRLQDIDNTGGDVC